MRSGGRFDLEQQRAVALKLLPEWLSGDANYRARFRREAQTAATLNEPHVIPIHRFGEIDGRLFLDMRVVDGDDLAGLIRRDGPLAPGRAVGIVEQVASALDAAHASGLVHRDVKPSNVLVRPGPVEFAYLVDFGIARALDSTKISLTGTVVGTPAYMAPERFDGDGDHRGDVYALGCVLYETLTGQLAFQAPHLFAYAQVHQTRAAPRPTAVRSELPAGLDPVVAQSLAKDSADRYPSAGALAAAARAALIPPTTTPTPPPTRGPDPAPAVPSVGDHVGRAAPTTVAASAVTARSPSSATRPQPLDPPHPRGGRITGGTGRGAARVVAESPKPNPPPMVPAAAARWRRRRRWIAAVLGLVLAAVAAGIALIATQGSPPSASPDSTSTVEHTLAGHSEPVNSVAVAQLDGRPVIVSGSVDRTVRVWDLATYAPIGQPLTGHTDFVNSVAVAQLDGRPVIVSGSSDETVRVWDLATHAPIGQPLTGHTGDVYSVAVAQLDGRPVIISGSQDNTMRVWELATGAPIGQPVTNSGIVLSVAVAQLDGRPVIISGSKDVTVRVWDLADRIGS
ncbi:serine/threonine-protein kinase [Pseudonocardia sp.]|uniref:serine/threonine-protein kinase n=1 Tax=Pseudonocardia sp. TaxID=60912 RepID=UPI003D0FB0F4